MAPFISTIQPTDGLLILLLQAAVVKKQEGEVTVVGNKCSIGYKLKDFL